MANPDRIQPGTPLFIVKVREPGDDEQWEDVLHTLDPDLRDEVIRRYLPDYPDRRHWEPHVLIEEAELDRPR